MAPDPSSDQSQDLREIVRVLTRRRWLILSLVIGIPLVTYLFTSSARPSYEAAAITQVQGAAVDTTLFGAGPSSLQTGAIAATAELAKSTQVASAAASRLHPRPASLTQLLASVTVTTAPDTGFVTITAKSLRALRAAAIANAFAEAVVQLRSEQARRQVASTITAVAKQLAALPESDRTGRNQLSDQLQRLRALAAAQGSNAILLQAATVPGSPTSPKPVRDTALALVLAILLALGLAFLRDRLDRRIRRPEELAALTGLPLLSSVSKAAVRAKHRPLHESEAIQALRTNLTYFNVDSPVHSLIVTSAAQSEGKTTVAINLAISMAHSGKDVILIDADLRRSGLAARMGLEGAEPNLGAVLAHGVPPGRGLREVATDAGRLRVLPAGPAPPNPSELMSSQRMRSILRGARKLTDVVIIDATPVLPVSDIVPLLREVSGIVLLARMNRTTRDAVGRAQDVIRLAEGTILGVVATAASDQQSDYGYGYKAPSKGWFERRKTEVVSAPPARRGEARPASQRPGTVAQPSPAWHEDFAAQGERKRAERGDGEGFEAADGRAARRASRSAERRPDPLD